MIRTKRNGVMMATAMSIIGLVYASMAMGQEAKAPDPTPEKTPKVQPALGGYSPASYLIDRKAIKGDPKYQTKFRGRLYYHASAERKAQFEKDPDKYLPQLDGLCTTALGGDYGNRIPGDPQVFNIVDGKVYLFSSLRAWRAYNKDPERFLKSAEERFNRPMLQGYCPVTYHEPGQARKGEARFTAVYDGKVFRFVDGIARQLFNENPEKYMPAYDGFGAAALAHKREVMGDPTLFIVEGGRSYFFATEEGKKEFQADPKKIIEQADKVWAEIH